tara:strand:- start:808 stop:2580 length:1773 start_codon:yes stop_codon:yes gene_type:complete
VLKINNSHREIRARIYILITLCTLAIICLFIGYAHLTLNQNKRYHELAINNFQKNKQTRPIRGTIFDRNHRPLADNKIVYHAYLRVTDDISQQTIARIEDLITIDEQSLSILSSGEPIKSKILLKKDLSQNELAALGIHQHDIPGLIIEEELIRTYPYGHYLSHVVGTSQTLEKNVSNHSDSKDFYFSVLKGMTGIEKTFDTHLAGIGGWEHITKTATGEIQSKVDIISPSQGKNIKITIDAELQKAIYELAKDYNGSIIVTDVESGEILAALSLPSFDPNQLMFTHKKSGNQFFNRITHGLYPPASTVKPLIALEALNQKIITEDTEIDDPGFYETPNKAHRYNDWQKHGHGIVNIQKAIAVSCDTFFYHIAQKMGPYNLFHSMQNFGLGQATGVELPNEKRGLIPTPNWKSMKKQRWFLGDSIITGIGQGATSVTPLQLAQATLLLAKRGNAKQIHLTKALSDDTAWTEFQARDYPPIEYKTKHWDLIARALEDVIKFGTGHRFHNNPYRAAGKTGTAQVVNISNQNDKNLKSQDHSLFIGYAPSNSPKVSIVVILEHNPYAAKLASDIISLYFENFIDDVQKTVDNS